MKYIHFTLISLVLSCSLPAFSSDVLQVNCTGKALATVKSTDNSELPLSLPFDVVLSKDPHYKQNDAKVIYVESLDLFVAQTPGETEAIVPFDNPRSDGYQNLIFVPGKKVSSSQRWGGWGNSDAFVSVDFIEKSVYCHYKYL